MDADTKVSIIMPTYNAQLYIEQAVNSVIYQTFSNWELIIIDDGSTDRTRDIIREMIEKDSRIRYICNEQNRGVAFSRNAGVKNAKGEWVAFLDSDDLWHKNKLEKQIICAEQNKGDFIFTGSSFMDRQGKFFDHTLQVPYRISYRKLLKQNLISCSSVLIRRNYLLEYPMEGGELHEDFAVWLQILREKKIFAYGVNEPLLVYRIHGNSKSGNKIKAAKMTYRVYRYVGLSPLISVFYWGVYVVRSIFKYKKIYK